MLAVSAQEEDSGRYRRLLSATQASKLGAVLKRWHRLRLARGFNALKYTVAKYDLQRQLEYVR